MFHASFFQPRRRNDQNCGEHVGHAMRTSCSGLVKQLKAPSSLNEQQGLGLVRSFIGDPTPHGRWFKRFSMPGAVTREKALTTGEGILADKAYRVDSRGR